MHIFHYFTLLTYLTFEYVEVLNFTEYCYMNKNI